MVKLNAVTWEIKLGKYLVCSRYFIMKAIVTKAMTVKACSELLIISVT